MSVLVVAGALVGGCGGNGKGEDAQIRSVVRRWLAAFANGNGPDLCSLMTPRATRQLLSGEYLHTTNVGRRARCPEEVRKLHDGVIKEFHEARRGNPLVELLKVKVDVRSLSSQDATARLTFPAGNVTDLPLSKTTAGWRISGEGRCVPVPKRECPSSP
jgi:hypothetical protein